MPFVRDNPDWYVLEIVDGFGAHLKKYDALKMRLDAKIICVKEEGDSSSVNQAYDKFVAKSDKKVHRQTLDVLREMAGANGIFNQWQMVQCGLSAIRATADNPNIWINSFKAVNLHPKYQISFIDWCNKMSPFMQPADSFDLVVQDNVDKYKLLPALWQAIPPEEKKTAVEIVQRNNGAWSVDCMTELAKKLTLSLSDLPAIQVAIWHSIEKPADLDRGMEDQDNSITPIAKESEVISSENERQKATDGLSKYELKQKD